MADSTGHHFELAYSTKELDRLLGAYRHEQDPWELRCRGGPGDIRPPFPKPIVAFFYAFAGEHEHVPSPDEFADYVVGQPEVEDWLQQSIRNRRREYTEAAQRQGFYARLRSNFWPSCMRELYLRTFLIERRLCDKVVVNTIRDCVGKIDLLCWSNGKCVRIGISSNLSLTRWKQKNRPGGDVPDLVLVNREIRWTMRRVGPLLQAFDQLQLFGGSQ